MWVRLTPGSLTRTEWTDPVYYTAVHYLENTPEDRPQSRAYWEARLVKLTRGVSKMSTPLVAPPEVTTPVTPARRRTQRRSAETPAEVLQRVQVFEIDRQRVRDLAIHAAASVNTLGEFVILAKAGERLLKNVRDLYKTIPFPTFRLTWNCSGTIWRAIASCRGRFSDDLHEEALLPNPCLRCD